MITYNNKELVVGIWESSIDSQSPCLACDGNMFEREVSASKFAWLPWGMNLLGIVSLILLHSHRKHGILSSWDYDLLNQFRYPPNRRAIEIHEILLYIGWSPSYLLPPWRNTKNIWYYLWEVKYSMLLVIHYRRSIIITKTTKISQANSTRSKLDILL